MQNAGHKPVFDDAALPFAQLSAAAAHGDAAAFDALWQDHKRPEQARASAARSVFTGACQRGDVVLAAWMQEHYTQHIDTKTLKDAGRQAITSGNTPVWDYLCGVLDAHRAGASVYAELFRPALESAPLSTIQKIFPHVSIPVEQYIYVPLLGGNMAALCWLTETAAAQGALGSAALDGALRMAVERAKTPMITWLLGAGAAPADCMAKPAVQRAAEDGGDILELLVRAGLNPRKAAEAAGDDTALVKRVQQAAAETAAHHLDILHAHCGNPPLPEKLRSLQGALGMRGLHYAAEHRVLGMIDRAVFTAADLAQQNPQGETVMDVLARRGEVQAFFTPETWRGQVDKLAAAFALLPAAAMDSTARDDVLRKAEQFTLDDVIPASGFKLKRRPSI